MIDEPVQRYLNHAIAEGAPLHSGALLAMRGRIRVGPWLSFDARQEFHGHAFTWSARAGLRPFRPLRVTDRYADGGNVGQDHFGYIPFGGEIHAERRFGAFTLPSSVTVGWWFGTPRHQPFLEATILSAEPVA